MQKPTAPNAPVSSIPSKTTPIPKTDEKQELPEGDIKTEDESSKK